MYIKITDAGPVAYSLEQLRRDNPTTSFPQIITDKILADFGVYPYELDSIPDYDARIGYITPGKFINKNGNWVQSWDVIKYTQDELDGRKASLIAEIKVEARRRILEIVPEWKQSNLTARAAELAIKGIENWTEEEHNEYTRGQEIWNQVKRIRIASDAIEAMNPIPADYTSDIYWS